MAWEWVAPVCTSGVGAIGIIATALTSRGARMSAERLANAGRAEGREAVLRAERREAYAALLTKVDTVQPEIIDLWLRVRSGKLTPMEAHTEYTVLLQAFEATRSPVRLIGSVAVRTTGWRLANAVRDALVAAAKGGDEQPKVSPELFAALDDAMRIDLELSIERPKEVVLPTVADSLRTEDQT